MSKHPTAAIDLTKLVNDNASVESDATAQGMTDALYHHDEPGYLMLAIKRRAAALEARDIDARNVAFRLFVLFAQPAIRDEMARACGAGRQYALAPVEQTADSDSLAAFPAEIRKKISPQIASDLSRLRLAFTIVPERKSLASLSDVKHGLS